MIKNIIFDLGKVLVDYDYSEFFQKYNLGNTEIEFTRMSSFYEAFNRGDISRNEFLLKLRIFLNTDKDLNSLAKDWASIFSLLVPMTKIAEELSEKFEIFIFSNTDEIHFNHIKCKFKELSVFGENLMLSYELGCLKPDEKAYTSALNKFTLFSEESLFIDDRIENVKAANDLGITAIHHLDFASTKQKLEEILGIHFK